MLRWFAPWFALFLGACVSLGPSPTMPSVRAETLVGLSQEEVRARLGGDAGQGQYFSNLSLEDGVRVTEGDWRIYRYPNPCSRGFFASYLRVNRALRLTEWRFHDDRLVSLTHDGRPLEADDRLALMCTRTTPSLVRTESDLLMLPFIPIIAPVALAHNALKDAQDNPEMRARAFSALRFGAHSQAVLSVLSPTTLKWCACCGEME